MVTDISKTFLQTESFFVAWNQKQMVFMLRKTGPRERKLLNFKRSSETFTQDTKAISNYIYVLYHSVILLPRIQKLYQITYMFSTTRSSVSIKTCYTNWLVTKGTFGVQRICRAHLFIQTTRLHSWLPWYFVRILFAYSRRKLRSNRCTTLLKCCEVFLIIQWRNFQT